MKRADEDDTKLWATVMKLVIGALLLIGGVGLALWVAAQGPAYSPAMEQSKEEVRTKSTKTPSTDTTWGISKDSPLRK